MSFAPFVPLVTVAGRTITAAAVQATARAVGTIAPALVEAIPRAESTYADMQRSIAAMDRARAAAEQRRDAAAVRAITKARTDAQRLAAPVADLVGVMQRVRPIAQRLGFAGLGFGPAVVLAAVALVVTGATVSTLGVSALVVTGATVATLGVSALSSIRQWASQRDYFDLAERMGFTPEPPPAGGPGQELARGIGNAATVAAIGAVAVGALYLFARRR